MNKSFPYVKHNTEIKSKMDNLGQIFFSERFIIYLQIYLDGDISSQFSLSKLPLDVLTNF